MLLWDFYHEVCICETHIQISITIHNFSCDLKNNIIMRTAINWNHDNEGSVYSNSKVMCQEGVTTYEHMKIT